MRKPTKLFLSLALTFSMALGVVPIVALASAGTSDGVALAEDSDAGEASEFNLSCTVVGPSASGGDEVWVNFSKTYETSMNAAELTEAAIGTAGLTYDAGDSGYGWSLNSITSIDGRTLGMAQNEDGTWYYWQLFVNGESSQLMADGVELADGDSVVWYYSAYGSAAPNVEGGVVTDPDAERPSYTAEWNGFANAGNAVTTASTPTSSATTSWVADLKLDGASWASVSDPVLVNGKVFIATGDELRMYDQSSSKVEKTVQLASSIDYTCRMVYADGILVVPLAGGRLQAFTADTLTCTWVTDAYAAAEKGAHQSLTTLTVHDGCVYYGTAVADWSTTYQGVFCCVDLEDGSLAWDYANEDAGFYWAGAAVVGDYLVMADDAGKAFAFNASTGTLAATYDLGASVRSTVVALSGNQALVVSKDGVLHKLSVAANGSISEVGKVAVAAYSTCTPTVVDGKAYVGGSAEDYTGVLSVVDVATMKVESSVTLLEGEKAIPAQVQSTPVVSKQDGGTYVYFTSNAGPGGVYVYKLGDETAKALFSPAGEYSNYCLSSIAVDTAGALYYTNDSGNLFKLVDPANAEATVEMYRLYNPNSGEHFYTANAAEKSTLVAAGWRYEGIGWTAPAKSGAPVYRLYNPNAGDHHYTTSAAEKDDLVEAGWRYEGIGWYSAGAADGAKLYRLYNPNAETGAHHFTLSATERDGLVEAGWRFEGTGWYGVK